MRLVTAALAVFGAAQGVLAAMTLVNPPPFSGRIDPSQHAVRAVRELLDLQWTLGDTDKKFSIVLYRLNTTQAEKFNGQFTSGDAGRMEMIARDLVDDTSYSWTVQTGESRTGALVFSIALWLEGNQVTDSASELFIISRDAVVSSSSSTTSSTASFTSQVSKISLAASSTSAEPSLTPTTNSESSKSTQPAESSPISGGLPTGGIVGAAIGAVAGAIFLFAAGWFVGRRQALHAMMQYYQQPPKYSNVGAPAELNAGPAAVEVPSTHYRPYEMAGH